MGRGTTTGLMGEETGSIRTGSAVLDLYAIAVRDLRNGGNPADIETSPCIVCGETGARPRYEVDIPGATGSASACSDSTSLDKALAEPVAPIVEDAVPTRDISCSYRVVDCLGCGSGRLEPLPSPAEIAEFYPQAYYGRGGSKFSGTIEWLVRLVGARHARFLMRQSPAGARVLDVGCGRGVALSALARSGLEAHGFERSADAVRGIDPRVTVHIADDLAAADYPAEYFDTVIIWHVLEHVRNPHEVLLEVGRILRTGGRVIVAVPNYSSLQSRWAGSAWFHLDLPRHLFHFPVAGLRQLLEQCGFECRSEHHFSLRQNPFGWIQSILNRSTRLPRNGLYVMLQRRKGDRRPRFSLATRVALYAALMLLSGPALVLTVVAAFLQSGATVHVVAVKR